MSQILKDCSYEPGSITVGESEGKFIFIPFEDEENEHKLKDLVPSDILIIAPLVLKDHSSSFTLPYTNESAFHPTEEHLLKTAWLSWRDKGTLEMLQLLSTQDDSNASPRLCNAASSLLKCFEHWNNFYSTITFQPRQVNHEVINEGFSPITSWSTSVIRAMAVHPHLPLIAVCRQDDIIEVRDTSVTTTTATLSMEPPVLLKDRYQVSVSSLQWACHSNTLLAVGVLGGVVLWYIDITHRNIKHPCTFLPCFESVPVISLKWCPKGRLLACGTPTDSALLVWDVPLMASTKLKRVHGGGVSLINWSPTGDWLFVGHVNSLCRVWETRQWTCEKWTNLAGRCKASCWSPKGDYLVFAVENDPSLYYISLKNRQMTLGGNGISAAVKCADLSECPLGNDDDDNLWIGGTVQWLSWHNSGKRLAVLFNSSNAGGSKVVVFRTQCFPVLELFPGGVVSGKEDEFALWVEFADYSTDPAILVTGWDSGRISFLPFQNKPVSSSLVPEKIGTTSGASPLVQLPVLAPPISTVTPIVSQPPPTLQLYTNQL